MTDLKLPIPFLDLKAIDSVHKNRYKEIMSKVIDSGVYINGPYLALFEAEYAHYCGASYCVGVGNGLDALTLILRGYIVLGRLNEGDKVIVPANTFIATVLSVIQAGLEPVFVEPDDNTFNLNVELIKEKCDEDNIKAIIITHLYGLLAPMEGINQFAKEKGILVIDDAAQAHGAILNGKKSGNLCDATAFSFYPTKNLGGIGDGGAITTNDEYLAKTVKKLSNYGSREKYKNDLQGVNSRLDEIQAAVLLEKLNSLDKENEFRRSLARQYFQGLNNKNIKLPYWDGSKNNVFHLFVIRIKDREHFIQYLESHHIGYGIHYPIPPHKQDALSDYSALNLSITERIHKEVVSLPLNLSLTYPEVEYIIKVLNNY